MSLSGGQRKGMPPPPPPGGDSAWATLRFTDIPHECYAHVLAEALKGMMFVNATKQRDGVADAVDEATQQHRLATAPPEAYDVQLTLPATFAGGAMPPEATVSTAGPTLFSSMMKTYNAVLATFGASAAEREADASVPSTATGGDRKATSPNEGGGGGGFGAFGGGGASSRDRAAPQAMIGLNATMSGFVDKRVSQMEAIVVGLRDDRDHLRMQLDDLRVVHDQLHSELTRSYKEYDAVQRQLMELLAQKRGRQQSVVSGVQLPSGVQQPLGMAGDPL
jgi:hypothetical protein